MMTLLGGLLDWLVPLLIAALGLAAAWWGGKSKGRADKDAQHATDELGAQRRTTDAYLGAAGDPDAVRKRLRDPRQPW